MWFWKGVRVSFPSDRVSLSVRGTEPPSGAAMELESAVETLEPLLFLIRRLLDRLTLELRAGQHVAAAIDFTIRLESDARHTRNFRLNGYTRHASPDSPQYAIKSSRTEHIAFHKGEALRRIRRA